MAEKIAADAALERLRQGNRRFVAGSGGPPPIPVRQNPDASRDQSPFAIILGCSDSRVPAEIVFDQGLGDLFVIRVAGNIVAPSQVGSVEFAADQFGTALVVVMGHSNCGAVTATLDSLERRQDSTSSNVLSIINRIRPAVEPLCNTELKQERGALLQAAIRANIQASVNHLRHGSSLLETLVAANALTIVGAEYSLESGEVDFFDLPGEYR